MCHVDCVCFISLCLSDCNVGNTGAAALVTALEKNTTLLVLENSQESYRPDDGNNWDTIHSLLLRNNQVRDSS